MDQPVLVTGATVRRPCASPHAEDIDVEVRFGDLKQETGDFDNSVFGQDGEAAQLGYRRRGYGIDFGGRAHITAL